MDTPDYVIFKKKVLQKTGIDLEQYKQEQMHRRLRSLATARGAADFLAYYALIDSDPAEFRRFIDHLTINVSEFFRNPEKFQELFEQHLPSLVHPGQTLKVWSAGCSTGEEPYTLAILTEERFPHHPYHILATDLDERALATARAGIYAERQLANAPATIKARYFTPDNGSWAVASRLKQRIEFRRHNLLQDEFPSGLDLVVCRNVVIYFTREAKEKLFSQFAMALRPGGIFFVGSTESIFDSERYGLKLLSPFIYARK